MRSVVDEEAEPVGAAARTWLRAALVQSVTLRALGANVGAAQRSPSTRSWAATRAQEASAADACGRGRTRRVPAERLGGLTLGESLAVATARGANGAGVSAAGTAGGASATDRTSGRGGSGSQAIRDGSRRTSIAEDRPYSPRVAKSIAASTERRRKVPIRFSVRGNMCS